MNEVIMLVGCMASGKTSVAQEFLDKGYVHLNRDSIGGPLDKLIPLLDEELNKKSNILLDNTFGTIKSRRLFIETCQKHDVGIRCLHLDTSVEDAQFNAACRMIERYGKLLSLPEIKKSKDPNIFPISALFAYHKKFEEPTLSEGFSTVEKIKFVRRVDPINCNKALILDFDGTLRKTKSGKNYPLEPEDVEVFPGRTEILQAYKDDGYVLLGVSNQSGIEKGKLSNGAAKACFDKTNQLLKHEIDYVYCPHGSFPISCYCRKPLTGWAAYFIEKYKLNASQCIFVGDLKTDETFAKRSGFQFKHADNFFK